MVFITLKANNEPNKYEPLSPKNRVAFGKLKSKKDIRTTIWAVITIARSWFPLFKFIYKSIKFIIRRWIVKSPLKPSTRLAPLIINKKQIKIKNYEKNQFFINKFKKLRSREIILIEKKYMKKYNKIDIISSL